MHHPLLLLFPFVLAATRSLTVAAIGPTVNSRRQALLSAEAEYEMLLVVLFCVTGLLGTLIVILQFPELGAVVAEYNQF